MEEIGERQPGAEVKGAVGWSKDDIFSALRMCRYISCSFLIFVHTKINIVNSKLKNTMVEQWFTRPLK